MRQEDRQCEIPGRETQWEDPPRECRNEGAYPLRGDRPGGCHRSHHVPRRPRSRRLSQYQHHTAQEVASADEVTNQVVAKSGLSKAKYSLSCSPSRKGNTASRTLTAPVLLVTKPSRRSPPDPAILRNPISPRGSCSRSWSRFPLPRPSPGRDRSASCEPVAGSQPPQRPISRPGEAWRT